MIEHHRSITSTDGETPDLHVLAFAVDGTEKRVVIQTIGETITIRAGEGVAEIPKRIAREVAAALIEAKDAR